MPRAKLRREPCDCLDCREPAGAVPASSSAAVARQEPPPKSLVLCLSGALPTASCLQKANVPHLDSLVQYGWAGLLACRSQGLPLAQQLLGSWQAGVAPAESLPERFKQLRAVLLTDSAEVAQTGAQAGCYAVQQLGSSAAHPTQQPAAQLVARICKLLQVQPLSVGGTAASAAAAVAGTATAPALAAVLAAAGCPSSSAEQEEEGDEVIDMLILALDASLAPGSPSSNADASTSTCADSSTDQSSTTGSSSTPDKKDAVLEWADSLVRDLNQAPGFRDTVLLSLVLGPGEQAPSQQALLQEQQPMVVPGECLPAPQPAARAGAAAGGLQAAACGTEVAGSIPPALGREAAVDDFPPVRRPLQSYQFAGVERVSVNAVRPAVVVHRLPGVIRVDRASALDLQDIMAHGGAGCILAERMLPELAYKLGRAPKYGA